MFHRDPKPYIFASTGNRALKWDTETATVGGSGRGAHRDGVFMGSGSTSDVPVTSFLSVVHAFGFSTSTVCMCCGGDLFPDIDDGMGTPIGSSSVPRSHKPLHPCYRLWDVI
jgi:hypothetical protein